MTLDRSVHPCDFYQSPCKRTHSVTLKSASLSHCIQLPPAPGSPGSALAFTRRTFKQTPTKRIFWCLAYWSCQCPSLRAIHTVACPELGFFCCRIACHPLEFMNLSAHGHLGRGCQFGAIRNKAACGHFYRCCPPALVSGWRGTTAPPPPRGEVCV